jgi:hypothetical protein
MQSVDAVGRDNVVTEAVEMWCDFQSSLFP